MRLINRAAVIVKPKQPFVDWANSLDDDGVKFDPEKMIEHHVYLIDDIADYVFDIEVLVRPFYLMIFEEQLLGWHRVVDDWPADRSFEVFLDWFHVEINSMVLDLGKGRIKSELY